MDGVPAQNVIYQRPKYYHLHPAIVWSIRSCGIVASMMVVIAVIFSIIKSLENGVNFLFTCNIIVSSVLCAVLVYWYRRSILSIHKHWFMVLLAGVIFFQCLAADLYVFSVGSFSSTPPPPPPPPTTATPHNVTGDP